MPDFARSPATPHAATIIREAVVWCRARGLRVAAKRNPGVHCVSGAISGLATWEPDPSSSALCPLGCAILKAQPQVVDLDDAAVIAAGASLAWLDGFTAGLTKSPLETVRTDAVDRAQAAAGWEAGSLMRAWLYRAEVVQVPPAGSLTS